ENVDELAVPFFHRNGDAFAEVLRVEIGPAAELAAAVARYAVDPKGEPDAVAEYKIDRALLQGFLRVVGSVECGDGSAREELLEIRLVPSTLGHADLLALECLWTNIFDVAVLARDEACGRRIIAGGEVGLLERLRADADRGNGRVSFAVVEGRINRVPVDGLDLALDLQLLANGLGKVDVKSRQRPHLVEIVERRIVAVGDEGELVEPVHVGPRAEYVALPGVRHDLVLGLLRGSRRRRKHAQRQR